MKLRPQIFLRAKSAKCLGKSAPHAFTSDPWNAEGRAPGRTRTCDPRLRRPVLYPTELRAPDGTLQCSNRARALSPSPGRPASAIGGRDLLRARDAGPEEGRGARPS